MNTTYCISCLPQSWAFAPFLCHRTESEYSQNGYAKGNRAKPYKIANKQKTARQQNSANARNPKLG